MTRQSGSADAIITTATMDPAVADTGALAEASSSALAGVATAQDAGDILIFPDAIGGTVAVAFSTTAGSSSAGDNRHREDDTPATVVQSHHGGFSNRSQSGTSVGNQ